MDTTDGSVKTYVYVDIPNVIGSHRNLSVDFRALIADIRKRNRVRAVIANVHFYPHASDVRHVNEEYDQLAQELANDGIEASLTVCPRRKDVDQLIVDDLWRQSARHIRGGAVPERLIRHVIVSGDGGFIRTVEAIQEAFTPLDLRLQVQVYSWRSSCSSGWRSPAYQIRYLDTVPGILPETEVRTGPSS